MKIIIVGGGKIGIALVNILVENHKITIIEKENERAEKVASKTTALILNGDGSDISVLKEAELAEADALIVTTSDDKTNLMICTIAKTEEVKKIIAVVNSSANEDLFHKLGITNLVSVVGASVSGIIRNLHQMGSETIVAQLGNGEMQVMEIHVPKGSKVIGASATLQGATVAAIYRSGDVIVPDADTVFAEGDTVLVIATTENIHSVSDLIEGS